MKTKRILCLTAVVLMLVCFASCAKISNPFAREVEFYDCVSRAEASSTLSLSKDPDVLAKDGTVLLAKAAAETSPDEPEEDKDTTTAGIVVMVVAGLGIVGGIALKVIQKRR